MQNFGHTFASDEAYLDGVAVEHGGYDGGETGRDEVNVLWGGVRTIDAGSKGKRDGFEAGEKRLPQLGGEPIEE